MHAKKPRIVRTLCEGDHNPLGVETLEPRLTWVLEGVQKQTAYEIQAASRLELLIEGQADLWASGWVESSQSVFVPYAGEALGSRQRVYWRVRVWDGQGEVSDYSDPASWEMGLLEQDDWTAQWIGRPGAAIGSYDAAVLPSPLFRKSFSLDNDVVSARAYVCGLGYFELYLNGKRVGDHVLDPIVTQYEKHVGYLTHDVSELIAEGENTVSLMLGNGWYNTHSTDVWHFDKASWRDYPKLLLQLEVTYSDGRIECIISDSSWRVTDGPIRFDGYRNGEIYDAREEQTGWNNAGYDDSDWKYAVIVPGPGGQLFSQQAPPCRAVDTLEAISYKEVKAGVWVFDFGQNLAGWVQLQVTGEAGTEVVLRYGERLAENGEVDQEHIAQYIQGDFQTDRYILAGNGEERYETRFTYHGFQYVQVEGLPQAPNQQTLTAKVVHSDFAPAGEFVSSDTILNRLNEMVIRTYRAHFVGIPTDNPHREKNGWTCDAQLACEIGLYNFDARKSYEHWLGTIADAQRANGQLPGIVPTGGWGFNWGNGPAWDSAIINIPWQMYLFGGDKAILQNLYAKMKRYVDFAFKLTDSKDGLIKYGLGDWCAPDMEKTANRDLVTTAILLGCCQTMGKIAHITGHSEDITRFEAMVAQLRTSWRAAFVNADGSIANDEQTSLACALHFGLLDEAETAGVVGRLRKAVADAEYHPTFGIVGAKWVTRALSDAGYTGDAFKLICNEGYPGWVHWLRQGATTIWEQWGGESARNQIAFGEIGAWMYRYLVGIRPLETHPGFERFTVAPQLVESLEWMRAEHNCSYGRIISEWTRLGNEIQFRITVPANATAVWTPPLRNLTLDSLQQLQPGKHSFTFDVRDLNQS